MNTPKSVNSLYSAGLIPGPATFGVTQRGAGQGVGVGVGEIPAGCREGVKEQACRKSCPKHCNTREALQPFDLGAVLELSL